MGSDKKKKSKKQRATSEPSEEEVYVVEAILDKRFESGKPNYLVKWKDWPSSSNTWEPAANLHGCPDLLQKFEKEYQTRGTKKKSAKKVVPDGGTSVSETEKDDENEEPDAVDVDVLDEPPPGKEPVCLLGVVPISGVKTYLVKWKPKGAAATEENVHLNLIQSEVFKKVYTQMVIEFYEKNIVWNKDDLIKSDVPAATAQPKDKEKKLTYQSNSLKTDKVVKNSGVGLDNSDDSDSNGMDTDLVG